MISETVAAIWDYEATIPWKKSTHGENSGSQQTHYLFKLLLQVFSYLQLKVFFIWQLAWVKSKVWIKNFSYHDMKAVKHDGNKPTLGPWFDWKSNLATNHVGQNKNRMQKCAEGTENNKQALHILVKAVIC